MDYPGVHGAPDIYGPAHHGMHTGTMPLRSEPYNDHELDVAEPIMVSYRQNQPGVISLDDGIHKQAHPWGSEPTFLQSQSTYNPFQSEHTSDQVLGFPRGHSVINRKSNFEEVKHVAPPNLAEALGWDPQGRNKPLSFVYNEHDLVVDESVPNRRGVSLSGLSRPQSRGHAAYLRGLAGQGPGRKVPALRSSGFTSKDHVRAMMSQRPAVSRLKRIRLPGPTVKQFVQYKPIRHMTKPKSGPVWINH